MFIRKLLCSHTYNKSMSCKSIRKGNDNYVYDFEHYQCDKCGKYFSVKILRSIEFSFYKGEE